MLCGLRTWLCFDACGWDVNCIGSNYCKCNSTVTPGGNPLSLNLGWPYLDCRHKERFERGRTIQALTAVSGKKVAFKKTDTSRLLRNKTWVSSLMALLVWGTYSEQQGKLLFTVSWQHISTLTHRIDTCAAGQWLPYYDAIQHNHTLLTTLYLALYH